MSNASVNQIAQDLLELSRKLELVRSSSKNTDRETSRLSNRQESEGNSVVSPSVLITRPESADVVSAASYRPESSASTSDSKKRSNRSSSRASSRNGGFNSKPTSVVSNAIGSSR